MSPAHDNDPRDDDALAAEYVVGVLSADERRDVAARIEADPAFARLVDRWEAHLAPMDEFAPAEPPASAKRKLDERLFANAPAETASRSSAPAGLWSSLALWRGLSAAAVVAVALLAAQPYLEQPEQPEARTARLVASLAPQQSDVHYFVVYDAREKDIGLSHVTGERGADQDFELWVIEGDQPPASLGVVPAGTSVHLAVDQALSRKIEQGAVFAISLEPRGGSPTGQPTGPVVAAGDLREI